MINRHPSEEATCTLKMTDLLVDGTYKATVLTGDSPDAYNGVEHPHRVAPRKTELTFKKGAISLPSHSLTVVEVLR